MSRLPLSMRCHSVALLALVLVVSAAGATGVAADTPPPTPPPLPSAIGNEVVVSIAVSPAYLRTGLVVVQASPMGNCSPNCNRIWVSHDGGHTWHVAAARGWNQGSRPQVALDAAGHESLLAGSTAGILKSDDYGESWTSLGSGGAGTPTPTARYATDHSVAVAGQSDYVLTGNRSAAVAGSGGQMSDFAFAYAVSPASSGGSSPVLLGGIDKSTGLPAVQRCSAALACNGTATLAGSTSTAGPPNLALSTDFAHDSAVFAQTTLGISKSTNGGATFSPLALGATGATATSIAGMALASGYRENGPIRTAYAALVQLMGSGKSMKAQGGIYRSTDAGASWHVVGSPGPFDEGAIAVAVAPDGRLFGAYLSGSRGSGGLLCNTDATTWHTSCPPVGSYGTKTGDGGPGATSCARTLCSNAAGGTPTSSGAGQAAARSADPTDTNAGGSVAQAGRQAAASGAAGSSRLWVIALVLIIAAMGAALAVLRRRRGEGRSNQGGRAE